MPLRWSFCSIKIRSFTSDFVSTFVKNIETIISQKDYSLDIQNILREWVSILTSVEIEKLLDKLSDAIEKSYERFIYDFGDGSDLEVVSRDIVENVSKATSKNTYSATVTKGEKQLEAIFFWLYITFTQ